MIAALIVLGLVLIAAAILGLRIWRALASPAVRFTLLGLGTACLLAAATSALLAQVSGDGASTATAPPSQSARTPRLVVVGDDGPEGAIPRVDPAFQAALAAFEEQLRRSGVAVSDGRALATVNPLDRVRYTDAEIVQMARRQQRESIDAVVVFSLFVRLEFGQGGPTIAGRSNTVLSGRGIATLLKAADAANLGAFEAISPTRWPIGFDCARTCQVTTIGAESPVFAEALADQIVTKLTNAR